MNLKIMERYLRVNLLGPGSRLMKKRIYRAAVSQRLSTALRDNNYLLINFSFNDGVRQMIKRWWEARPAVINELWLCHKYKKLTRMGGKVSETSDSTALKSHYHDLSAATEITVTGQSTLYMVKGIGMCCTRHCARYCRHRWSNVVNWRRPTGKSVILRENDL